MSLGRDRAAQVSFSAAPSQAADLDATVAGIILAGAAPIADAVLRLAGLDTPAILRARAAAAVFADRAQPH